MEEVTIEKLVHGGQGLGTLADGRRVFVWGGLPNERVKIRLIKQKHSYAEAITTEVIKAADIRQKPREANYLATSPWQIIPLLAENEYKKEIVKELFVHARVALPDFELEAAGDEWHYRNKMEYSFWGDEAGLHLALHNRGSHHKTIVEGSELALPAVDVAARGVVETLNKLGARAGDFKTVIVRANQAGEAVASLFVKPKEFADIALPSGLKGLRVYHSNPKSPASVPTALLQETGDIMLTDKLLGKVFQYDADSFFQVNLPVFERSLQRIKEHITNTAVTDMYAGVGSIGLSIAEKWARLVELDAATAAMARVNAKASGLDVEVVEASTEKVTDYITKESPVIFDPPRAGLHDKVIDATLAVMPSQVIYLSCNPATHARDLAKLQQAYDIAYFEAFNFFPHTPHIETLAILALR